MQEYFDVLKECALFDGVDDFEKLFSCLKPGVKYYKKGSAIIMAGDEVPAVGIVLSGIVQVVDEDYLGNKNILTEVSAAGIFAETFVCGGVKRSPVSVLSVTECGILFVKYSCLIGICPLTCTFHTKLIQNMLRIIAGKNILLSQKIEFISKRTTREKLMSFFSFQMEKFHSESFTIDFSRHELADFLCVDRSAMSRELCRLRDEGVLTFKGNYFATNFPSCVK